MILLNFGETKRVPLTGKEIINEWLNEDTKFKVVFRPVNDPSSTQTLEFTLAGTIRNFTQTTLGDTPIRFVYGTDGEDSVSFSFITGEGRPLNTFYNIVLLLPSKVYAEVYGSLEARGTPHSYADLFIDDPSAKDASDTKVVSPKHALVRNALTGNNDDPRGSKQVTYTYKGVVGRFGINATGVFEIYIRLRPLAFV